MRAVIAFASESEECGCDMSDRWTIISTGVALGGLVVGMNSCLRVDMDREFADMQNQHREMNANIVDLRERVAGIETLLEYALPPPTAPAPEQATRE